MAYREVLSVEIREIIRRWQAGLSQRRIARGTGLSRQTVRRYIEAAEAAGLKPGGPEPGEEQLARLATLSSTRPRQVAVPSEELLAPWAEIGMRAGLLLTADTRLRREHGLTWDRISRGPRVARRSLER